MPALPTSTLAQLFTEARTHSSFENRPVSDDIVHQLYELVKWGPTSANSTPARFVFIRGEDKAKRLVPAMSEGNQAKTLAAPLSVIIAQDGEFLEHMPKLFPFADFKSIMAGKTEALKKMALQNSSLQGAYLILAARALGLGVGPMGGFDEEKINHEFFAHSSWRVNFIANLGYADSSAVHPRLHRLAFEEAVKIIG